MTEGLTLPPDPSEDIKRMLEAAQRSKVAQSPTPNTPELPEEAFGMTKEKLKEYLESMQGADVLVRSEPKVGNAVIDVNGKNLGIADSVTQPYGDNLSHYRVNIQGRRFEANLRG